MKRILDSFQPPLPSTPNSFLFSVSIDGGKDVGKTQLANVLPHRVPILNNVVELEIQENERRYHYFSQSNLRCILFDTSNYKKFKQFSVFPSATRIEILVGTKIDLIPPEEWKPQLINYHSQIEVIHFNPKLIFDLPEFIIQKIFSYFGISQLLDLTLISREWFGFGTKNVIWEYHYKRDYKEKLPFDLVDGKAQNNKNDGWMQAYKNIHEPKFVHPNVAKRFAKRLSYDIVLVSATTGYNLKELSFLIADTLRLQKLAMMYPRVEGQVFLVVEVQMKEAGFYSLLLTRDPDRLVLIRANNAMPEYYVPSSDIIDVQVNGTQIRVLDCSPKNHTFWATKGENDAQILGEQIENFRINNLN